MLKLNNSIDSNTKQLQLEGLKQELHQTKQQSAQASAQSQQLQIEFVNTITSMIPVHNPIPVDFGNTETNRNKRTTREENGKQEEEVVQPQKKNKSEQLFLEWKEQHPVEVKKGKGKKEWLAAAISTCINQGVNILDEGIKHQLLNDFKVKFNLNERTALNLVDDTIEEILAASDNSNPQPIPENKDLKAWDEREMAATLVIGHDKMISMPTGSSLDPKEVEKQFKEKGSFKLNDPEDQKRNQNGLNLVARALRASTKEKQEKILKKMDKPTKVLTKRYLKQMIEDPELKNATGMNLVREILELLQKL